MPYRMLTPNPSQSAIPLLGRRPIVGVMGSGSEEHWEWADPVGRLLARYGVHLLTGGGGGVMSRVSRAFAQTPERRGLVIGILPAGPPEGYPNPHIELPIRTHLDRRGRNPINVLTPDALIFLPGSGGTADELRSAIENRKPAIAFVDHPDAIEGLAESPVPWTRELEELERFVSRLIVSDRA